MYTHTDFSHTLKSKKIVKDWTLTINDKEVSRSFRQELNLWGHSESDVEFDEEWNLTEEEIQDIKEFIREELSEIHC